MASINIHPTRDTSRTPFAEAKTSKGTSWIWFDNGDGDRVAFFFNDPADMPKAEALAEAFNALYAPKRAVSDEEAA